MSRSHQIWFVAAAVAVALSASSPTRAQFVNRAAARWYVNGAVASGVYGPWWGGGARGTTAAEGYQRGMADVIRARGQAEANRAKAARDYEEARSRYIDNQTKWLEEYNERKRIGLAQQQEERQQRRDYVNRYRSARDAARSTELPIPSQVDPETGRIDWPIVLQSDPYSAETEKLDMLLREWAEGSDPAQLAPQVGDLVGRMQTRLRTHIRDYSPSDYIAADKLLSSLHKLSTTAG